VATEPLLVTLELRFTTDQDPEATAERIREAVAMIVGRGSLEDFRVRSMSLTPRDRRGT
jgi:hypothetical protein